MMIHSISNSMQSFTANKREKRLDTEAKEVAVVAGGATTATAATKLSKVNKTVIGFSKKAGTIVDKATAVEKEAKVYSSKIMGHVQNFVKSLRLNEIKMLKPLGRMFSSPGFRKFSGILGGAFAGVTATVGVVETVSTFANVELQKKN